MIYVSEAGWACNHLGRAIYEMGRKGSAEAGIGFEAGQPPDSAKEDGGNV